MLLYFGTVSVLGPRWNIAVPSVPVRAVRSVNQEEQYLNWGGWGSTLPSISASPNLSLHLVLQKLEPRLTSLQLWAVRPLSWQLGRAIGLMTPSPSSSTCNVPDARLFFCLSSLLASFKESSVVLPLLKAFC